ncbi:MAG: lysylphosphatidylglycerol synthase transmembrane domain-containing protein [Chloroflexi bacterium]|nr:lysylphosphatidylglycerol synthase transmembrane domain-containing protein [Chloroflexota bacterium]
MKRHLSKLWLVLAAVLLYVVLRGMDWGAAWTAVRELRGWQLAVLVVANGGMLATLFGRWAVILYAQGHRIPFAQVAQMGLAGYAVSYLTPGPQFGGEPLQVYLLHTRHGVSLATATAGVVLDKALALVTSFGFLLLGGGIVVYGGVLGTAVNGAAVWGGSLFLLLPLGLLVGWWRGRVPLAALAAVLRLSHLRPLAIVAEAEEQIVIFCRDHAGAFWLAMLLSVVSWLLLAGEYWLMAQFVGLRMTGWQAVALLTAVRLAYLLPMPGVIGSLEASQIWALGAMGLPPALGLSLSLLIRVRDVALALVGLAVGGRRGEK